MKKKKLKSRGTWFFIILLIVGLFLRISYVVIMRNDIPVMDAEGLDKLGMNIAEYGEMSFEVGNPTAGRSPTYPMFLAGIYYLFGHNYSAVRVFQSLISVLTCLIIYFICREVFNKIIGVIAFAISIFYPFFIYYTGYLLSETVYTFLISLSVLLTCLLLRKSSNVVLVIYGVVLSVTVLCKASFVIVIPFFLLFLLVSWGIKQVVSYRKIGVIIMVSMLLYMPWILRNYRVFKTFVPFATNGGMTLLDGSKLFHSEHIQEHKQGIIDPVIKKGGELSEIGEDRLFKREAMDFIKKNPGYMLKLTVVKFMKFWRLYPHVERRYDYNYPKTLLVIVSIVTYGPVLLFAIIGMMLSRERWWKEAPLYMVIISFVIIHLIFWSQIRYRLPIMPCMIIFAANGMNYVYNRFNKGK